MRLIYFRSVYRPVVRILRRMIADTYVTIGDPKAVSIGNRVGMSDCLLNTASGKITLQDDIIFGHNCMLITGTHLFEQGKRASLQLPVQDRDGWGGAHEVPTAGFDIEIKSGTWIGSGAIVVGPAVIGENCIIGSGAVVVSDIPSNSLAVGIPARVVKKL